MFGTALVNWARSARPTSTVSSLNRKDIPGAVGAGEGGGGVRFRWRSGAFGI
jgi:hypothetical protein